MRSTLIAIAILVNAFAGCGSPVTVEYPNRIVGVDGQLFALEDLQEIANDPNLDDDEKRQRFRDLGIDDEELIESLLTL